MNISTSEKLIFTKHLAVLIKSGINLTEAIDTLAGQSTTSNLSRILRAVHTDICDGSTLEKSLSKYPRIFDRFFLGIIKVGESSGTLDVSLEYLSQQLNREFRLRRKIQGALMYPALVLAATVFLGSFVSLFILPKLVDFFVSFEAQLPLSTVILLRIALFMRSYGVVFFSLVFGIIVLFTVVIKLPAVKPLWHRFILKIPIFGNLLREAELSRLSRSLGILIKSGLPLTPALEITSFSLENYAYRAAVLSVADQVSNGKNVAPTLRLFGIGLFPRLAVDIIAVGEKSGKIDESLLYISQFYDDDIDEITKNLSNILEPVLLLFIGLVVGFMSLAIISPIYQLTSIVGQ